MHTNISRQSYRILKGKPVRKRRRDQLNTESGTVIPLSICQAMWMTSCLVTFDMGPDPTEDSDFHPNNYCGVNTPSSLSSGVDAPRSGWMTWGSDAAAQSTVQHFLEALTLWKEVNLLTQSRTSSHFDTLLALDAKLRRFYAHVPNELKSTDLFWSQNSEAVQRNGFCLESIYHCSLLRLYASAIPAWSGEAKRGHLDVPLGMSSYCTKVVLENLNAFGELLKNYLCTYPDLSMIPSFLGHCAFIAGSAFSQLRSFGSGQRKSTSWAYGMLCLLFLDEIKGYYPVLNSKVCGPATWILAR
ncbi:hypothetical protein BJY01DRAFT_90827 [Aspergillus pseudoustus]|uniref:Transcription factor domain-containing protein n=1 Tax=Aspergillus pseudoustus TaxID=1810923 RepID=A0ABR4J208_9EURO